MKATIAILNKRDGKIILNTQNNQYYEPWEKKVFFNGRIYFPTSSCGTEIITKQLQQEDPSKAAKTFLKDVEGNFAFIITEPERIIAGRDSLGLQPLYYGGSKIFAAFATNKKALWNLDFHNIQSFPPGNLGFISKAGFKFKPIKTLVYSEPKHVTMKKAVEVLENLLQQSVRRCISGCKDIAIAFSGGLDSSIVAFLAKKHSVNVNLIHVSLENQPETEEAKKAAHALDLPLQVYLFREEEVEKVLFKVVEIIEEFNPVRASIGVPFYWVAEKTAKLGLKVIMAGQGADELFGGYKRYVIEYLLQGSEKVRKTMFNDVVEIHQNNLERDMKICNFHNLELRLPFGSYQIAKFAIDLPVNLKIERYDNTRRKLVLRKAAEKMGLPSILTDKPKKAVQYSTGVNKALRKIAKKQKTTIAEYVKKIFLNQMTKK